MNNPILIPMTVSSDQQTFSMSCETSIEYVRGKLQEKEATPSEQIQSITPDEDYDALSKVTVDAIPSDYIGSNVPRQTTLSALGNTVTAVAGYYEESVSQSVQSGSATVSGSITADPFISVDSNGLITATVSATESLTPSVTEGYITQGTPGSVSVSGSGTRQLPTRTSSDLSASGATVTAPAGWYAENASKAVAGGTEGTPTATKGAVSNHSISVTPSVTNTAGYINGGTKTGTAVTVSASELVSGTKSISANGTGIDVTNYQKVNVAVPADEPNLQTKSKTYTPTTSQQTDTITPDAGYDGLNEVDITVNPIPPEYIVPSGTYTVSASGTADITNYATLSVPSGSAGSPALSVSEVTDHAVTVRASTIRTAGWIPSGTVQGASRNISASDLVSGTKSITSNGTGIDVTNYASVDVSVSGGQPNLQTKSVSYTPTTSQQTASVTADVGYDGLDEVDITVDAMPSGTAGTPTATKGTVSNHSVTVTPSVTNTTGYITGGTKTGTGVSVSASDLVSGTLTINSSGTKDVTNYASASVAAGSATPASSISGTSATVSTGTNTITLSKTVSNTPQVSAGYISSGTAGNSSVSLTASVTTKGATTYTPTTTNQTIASGTYLTGTQTISGDANLVAGNIKSGTTIFGVTGTYTGGGGSVQFATKTVTASNYPVSLEFTGMSGEPKAFVVRLNTSISSSGSTTYYYIVDISAFGTTTHGNCFRIGSTRQVTSITSGYSWSYSGTTLTITSSAASRSASPGAFYSGSYELMYAY